MDHLTRWQCRRLDEIASTVYRMPTLLLMENAARSAAVLAGRLIYDRGGDVLILAGPGNNGGDGWGLARFLHNAGRHVTVAELSPPDERANGAGDAVVQRQIALAMGVEVLGPDRTLLARPVALVVDALFGTGLTRPLSGNALDLVRAVNVVREHKPDLPVLALDLPSGLDADTGEPLRDPSGGDGVAVRATHTVTFAAPKVGFLNPQSRHWTGEIAIGDIGVPRAAIEAAARETPAT
ncbi:MAG: NAD(P)H-hydrate epimerase [Tepidisphaerales bacterium]